MSCTYTLNVDGKDQEFPNETALKDYLRDNLSKFTQTSEQFDIPETFEGQRDQFVDRWKLGADIRHGQYGYISKDGKLPTLSLAKKMAKQLNERSGGIYDKLAIKYDSTYGLIHIDPRVQNVRDWEGPSYDVSEDQGKPPRTFQQMPTDFKMAPTDETRYFLSPAQVKTDTYTNQGEYFNVNKQRTGNAQQLAKSLGTTVEQLKDKVKGSNLQSGYLNDFLTGKNSVRLSLYKVDRVADPELFINPNEDQTIGSLRKSKIVQQKTLQRQIAQEKDTQRRSALYKDLNKIKAQIKELNKPENQNVAYLKKVFEDDKEAYGTKAYTSVRDINRAYNLFDGYETLFKGLDLQPFGEEVEKQFKDSLAEIRQIKSELQTMKDKESLKQMEFKTNVSLSDSDGNLLPLKDVNGFASWTLALSTTQNNPLVRYIGQTTNFAINKAKDKESEKKKQIKTTVHALQEYGKGVGLKGVKLYDYMLEEDENGKPTGHFAVKYGKFYTNLAKTMKGKDPKESTTKFLKYLRENTESITTLDDEFKAEWQRIHESTLQKVRDRSPLLDEQSIADAAVIETNKIAYGIDPANFMKLIDKFYKGGKIDDKDMAFVRNFLDRGGYYKFIKLQPGDEFRDKKFAAIDALPDGHPQKEFYKLFSELHYEINERVRIDEGATLRRNFIAEYKRDYKEEDESLFDYLKDTIHDWALGMLTESPRDNIQGLDPLTKEITRSIPFYAFDGRIDPENKNYNLGKVLGVLAQQFYKYEALSDVEDDLLVAQHVLKQTSVYETNAFGTPVIINGEPVIKKDTSAMYKQADYHILATLYNERMKKDGISGNRSYDAKTSRRIAELDELAKTRELDAAETDEYRKLKANYQSMTVKRATNALMHWTSIKNIGFNLFGGLAEIFQGTASLYLRYGGKTWGNTVLPTLLQLMNPQDSAAKNKMNNFRELFHIESDVNPNVEESMMKKVAYLPYTIARTMANTGYLIAILKDQRIKDKEGNEHPLHDVMNFDADGKIVLPDNFDNPFYNKDGSLSDYKYKLQQIVNKEIKQNRDRETDIDPIQLDQHFWGRLLGQFKASWLFEGFATRFGTEHEGLNDLDTASKGIYRSFWDLSKAYVHSTNALGETETAFSLPRTLLKAMINVVKFSTPGRLLGNGKRADNQTPLDYEGAVRTVREIQSAIFLYGMVMLVSGMASGDNKDRWRKMGLTYLTNYFMRTQRDISTYFDPDSLTSIINKNVIPSLGTVNEAVKLIEDPFMGIFGNNWYYNKGKVNEQFRITRDAADMIPLINQLRMTINKASHQQGIFY